MAQLISRGKSNTHIANWGKKPKQHNSCVLKVFILEYFVSGKSCSDYRWWQNPEWNRILYLVKCMDGCNLARENNLDPFILNSVSFLVYCISTGISSSIHNVTQWN